MPHFKARQSTSEWRNKRVKRKNRDLLPFSRLNQTNEIHSNFYLDTEHIKSSVLRIHSSFPFVLFMHLNRENIFIFGIDKINTPIKRGQRWHANDSMCVTYSNIFFIKCKRMIFLYNFWLLYSRFAANTMIYMLWNCVYISCVYCILFIYVYNILWSLVRNLSHNLLAFAFHAIQFDWKHGIDEFRRWRNEY